MPRLRWPSAISLPTAGAASTGSTVKDSVLGVVGMAFRAMCLKGVSQTRPAGARRFGLLSLSLFAAVGLHVQARALAGTRAADPLTVGVEVQVVPCKRMAALAVRFCRVPGSGHIVDLDVAPNGDGFEMTRVHAPLVPAGVVDLMLIRDRTFAPFVGNPVGYPIAIVQPKATVSKGTYFESPIPTAGLGVDANAGPETLLRGLACHASWFDAWRARSSIDYRGGLPVCQ